MGAANLDSKTRTAPLVVACVLCLGVVLCALYFAQPAAGSAGAVYPAAVHHYRAGTGAVAGASGGLHAQVRVGLAASVEEAGDEHPVKEGGLTALLFLVLPGAILGLLFGGRVGRRRDASLLAARRLPSSILPVTPRDPSPRRLSVFLL
jgi:hypothetical protein